MGRWEDIFRVVYSYGLAESIADGKFVFRTIYRYDFYFSHQPVSVLNTEKHIKSAAGIRIAILRGGITESANI